jgi:hypothetical protein
LVDIVNHFDGDLRLWLLFRGTPIEHFTAYLRLSVLHVEIFLCVAVDANLAKETRSKVDFNLSMT